MSRVRTRPTRDDTCEKLFEAAARVFEDQGIGGASIEAIVAAAGFTRGAFYSNFKSKDELIIAMIEDHVARSIRRNLDLLATHDNLADYIDALKSMDRSRQDPLARSPLLHMEMILFVARAEKRRPELAERLRARRKLIADIVETASSKSGKSGAQRNMRSIVKTLLTFAINAGMYSGPNPAVGIKLPTAKGDGFHSWTEAEIASSRRITRSARDRGSRSRSYSTPHSAAPT